MNWIEQHIQDKAEEIRLKARAVEVEEELWDLITAYTGARDNSIMVQVYGVWFYVTTANGKTVDIIVASNRSSLAHTQFIEMAEELIRMAHATE
jgi:hypothetical protein